MEFINSTTPHLTVYVGLLEENNYFSASGDPEDLAVRWCEALRQIAARDGVELTLRPGVGKGRVASGSAYDSGWWAAAADEAMSQADNLTSINTGAIGRIK